MNNNTKYEKEEKQIFKRKRREDVRTGQKMLFVSNKNEKGRKACNYVLCTTREGRRRL